MEGKTRRCAYTLCKDANVQLSLAIIMCGLRRFQAAHRAGVGGSDSGVSGLYGRSMGGHFSLAYISRSGGYSARAHVAYLQREGAWSHRQDIREPRFKG